MTEFGCQVWVLAAKRGITSIRGLTRTIEEVAGEASVHHDTVRNWMQGRTAVPHRFLKMLDVALELTEEERRELGQVFAWGQTTWESSATNVAPLP